MFSNVEIKYCSVPTGEINFFNQSIKNDLKTYDTIRKIATGQGDDNRTGCWLDYSYFKQVYTLISKDISKHQKLDTDPKAIQQTQFNGKLAENITVFLIIQEAKEAVLDYVLWFYFILM